MPGMRTPTLLAALASASAGLLACGGGLTVRATRIQGAPRPPGCELEILQKAPDRPHDLLAELEAHVTRVPPEGPLAVVSPKACALGADGIVVVRNLIVNEQGHALVAVAAIRWRPEAAEPRPPGPPPSSGEPAPGR